MKNIIKQSISYTKEKIKRIFEERDWEELIDLLVYISIISSTLFIVIYKSFRVIDEYFIGSGFLVIPDYIKSSLPQLFFFFIFLLGISKWIVRLKKGKKIFSSRENEEKTIDLKIGKIRYSITKETLSLLFLIGIITLFTLIKIPAWDTSFTVNHPMKYNTYVGPALNMLENNDPLFLQRKYMNNPLTNSLGVGYSFGNLPILEWILFVTYKIFNGILPFEITTRFAMNLIGSFTLLSFYLLIKKVFHTKVSLIATLLLAVNPIFNLASFVTVYDTINLGITFLALYLLLESIEEKNLRKFVLSAILIGITVSIKENLIIWSLPIVFTLLAYYTRTSVKVLFKRILTYIIFMLPPYVITFSTINYFPQKNPLHFILFAVLVLLTSLAFYKISEVNKILSAISEKMFYFINKRKALLLLIPILFIFGIKLVYSTQLAEEFLTDEKLILNIALYVRFINEQLIPYSTIFVFSAAVISLFLLLLYEKSIKKNILILSFFIGSIFYIVITSKVLYFHSYYWIPILSTVILVAAWGFCFLANLFFSQRTRFAYLMLLIIAISFSMIGFTKGKLDREHKEIYTLIEYFNGLEIPEGTTFIDHADLTYLTLKTDLYRLYDNEVFADPRFKDSVKEVGFTATMYKYRIEYIITTRIDGPDYSMFANAFSDQPLQSNSYRRSDIILSDLFPERYIYYIDTPVRDEILYDNAITKQFKLVNKIGRFSVYKVLPASFNTAIK